MYVASSNSSTASSDSSTTSDLRVVTGHRNGDRHGVGSVPQSNAVTGSRGQRSHKSTRGLTTASQQKNHQAPPTLQSLVKTKCWSIAPLWKFVTYELETQPNQPITIKNAHHFSRSASVRGTNKKNKSTISYENNFYDMASTNGSQRRGSIWSKPHPHQSLNHAKNSVSGHHGPPEPPPRQPLQLANRITTLLEQPYKQHHPVLTPNNSNSSSGSNVSEEPEFKPCGVLKKPGSYRAHAGLKKVAFLENTELNRSTL